MTLQRYRRTPGEEQPYTPLGPFKLRLPFIHVRWESAEMAQAIVVFVTGTAAIAYLQDIFGLPFEVALSIIIVHEALYLLNNFLGDPLVGGWITPAVPLIVVFLLQYEDENRIWALISLEIVLALIFFILGITKLAGRLVKSCPRSLKAGILVGASFSACMGKYGFMPEDQGGMGFWANPFSFSIGVLISLYLLYSYGYGKLRVTSDNIVVKLINRAGFVPALIIAGLVGMAVGEISIPSPDFSRIFFNPIPGLEWVHDNFSMFGLGLPPLQLVISAIPIAFACYLIAFGDMLNGTAILKDAQAYRQDEKIDMNSDLTNICCGIRNAIESLISPTVTMSGPIWTAMTITIAERYKSGANNMESIHSGAITFNTTKLLCHLVVPLISLVRPFLLLAMELTWMIQAFACFYIGVNMCRTNVERGIAGLTGGAIAVSPNPSIGLFIGLILCLTLEYLGAKKQDRAAQTASGLASTAQTNFEDTDE